MPPLPVVLAEFSSPQALETHIANFKVTKAIGLNAVTWLLQEGLAMQCHEYLSLIMPSSVKEAAQVAAQSKTAAASHSKNPSTARASSNDVDVNLEEGGRPIQRSDTGLTGVSEVESDLSHDNSSRFAESSDASGIQMANSAGPRSSNTAIRSPLSPTMSSATPYLVNLAQASPASGRPFHHRDLSNTHARPSTSFLTATVVPYPGDPTAEEELWISELVKSVEAAHGAGSTQAFLRYASDSKQQDASGLILITRSILPWLDGTHHIDEILYRTNLHRSSLRRVLADYAGYVITFVS